MLEPLGARFEEEPAPVQLALLTAAMRLFFKRPPETQRLLGRVLAAGLPSLILMSVIGPCSITGLPLCRAESPIDFVVCSCHEQRAWGQLALALLHGRRQLTNVVLLSICSCTVDNCESNTLL